MCSNLWEPLSQAVRGPCPLDSQVGLGNCGLVHTSSKELATSVRKDCAESRRRLSNWSVSHEFIISSQALTVCQSFSTHLEVTLTLSGRGQRCKQQLSAKQSCLCCHRGHIYEEACASTYSSQPSALLPSINSTFSFLLLTITIWALLMIYTSYSSLTDGKYTHGNFLPSTLIPRKAPK